MYGYILTPLISRFFKEEERLVKAGKEIDKKQSESSEEYLDTMALLIDELIIKGNKYLLEGNSHFLSYILRPKKQREAFENLMMKGLMKQPIEQNQSFGKLGNILLKKLEQPIIPPNSETAETSSKELISYYSLIKLAYQYQQALKESSGFKNTSEVSTYMKIFNDINDYSKFSLKTNAFSNFFLQTIF